MDPEELIKSRRSVRKYQDREIPTDVILKAIDLASWAASGGNHQAWQFYVVKTRETIDRIGDAVQAKVDKVASWPEAEAYKEAVLRQQQKAAFFRKAPVVIAVGSTSYESEIGQVLRLRGDRDPEAVEMARNRAETSNEIQSVASGITTLLLTLHKASLGACWMLGPMLARREIEQILQVPEGVRLFALIPVGYPAEAPQPKPRRPLQEVVRVI